LGLQELKTKLIFEARGIKDEWKREA
jgi:hypothetical protein